jgi:hypothetical protein
MIEASRVASPIRTTDRSGTERREPHPTARDRCVMRPSAR